MSRRGIEMTRAAAEAHQRRHGFLGNGVVVEAAVLSRTPFPKPSRQNKTELAYGLILEAQKRRGDILGYRFEAIKLRLADQCWYTPDFFVERIDALPLFIEIKGRHIWDDSKVKFKTAREIHTWADFEMWQKTKEGWRKIL